MRRHRFLKPNYIANPDAMKTLQTVTALVEAGAGLALLGVPSATAQLLFATPVDAPAAVGLARIGGAALLALAVVCWLARRDPDSPVARGLTLAMLFYNLVVAAMLAFAGFGQGLDGILLWPAMVFHVAMGGWCAATLYRNENAIFR